ncbi:MAG: TerB N-terminal domain-containing protein [Eubacterium sp.]|nr:TerB N-terminal domain-containing protein [Eubacterium sp.]
MELSDLTAYAKEKYHIEEQHKWKDFPGFSVLCHPDTGKWVALLMRQWDTDTGTEIQRCDLKCGAQSLSEYRRPYLSAPVRMKGKKWIGIAFGDATEPDVICRLFDRAVASGDQRGYTVVLRDLMPQSPAQPAMSGTPQSSASATPQSAASATPQPVASAIPQQITWQDVSLPFAGKEGNHRAFGNKEGNHRVFGGEEGRYRSDTERSRTEEKIPERIRQMRRLYDYGRTSSEARAKNFYRQAKYMEDYEDDAPWKGSIVCYFPTYHDLTTRQLRGYFAWRTDVRKGIFRPIAASAAYIYVYELLNGIGTASPEDSLQKLNTFVEKYIDSGNGDSRMRSNVMRWVMELAVISGLPPAEARNYMDPELLERDRALSVLQTPADSEDEEIISALCYFGGKRQAQSPVLTSAGEKGRHLFAEAWRTAAEHFRQDDKDLFAACFGKPMTRRWYPLSNAVYYWKERPADTEYELDACRLYFCKDGSWQVSAYEKLTADRDRIRGFLHTADLLLRRYLKTGRYLREKAEDSWAVPFVQKVIRVDEQAVIEAARPKITIDFSGLEQIRQDALVTQNSLLTEEDRELQNNPMTEDGQELQNSPLTEDGQELQNNPMTEDGQELQNILLTEEEQEQPEPQIIPESQELPEPQELPELPLDSVQIRILQTLLQNGSPDAFIRELHLMPSLVADAVNEALFDEIGDSVLVCDEDQLSLVEDYIEEIEELLGGIQTT